MSQHSPTLARHQDVLSVEQIRSIDAIAVRDFGMCSLVLMENAGRGCADFIHSRCNEPGSILIVCGPGNNGGDGLVIARHLHAMGHAVIVWMIAERKKLSGDTEINLKILEKTRIPIRWLQSFADSPLEHKEIQLQTDVNKCRAVVDAMLGTGASGPPRTEMAFAIRILNQAPLVRIAIDIPTGLDAETGIASVPTFRANETLTFVANKPGFLNPSAALCLGSVHILAIGVPPEVIDRVL